MLPINTFLLPFPCICIHTNQTNHLNSPARCHSFALILVLIYFLLTKVSLFIISGYSTPGRFPKTNLNITSSVKHFSFFPLYHMQLFLPLPLSDNLRITTLRCLLFHVGGTLTSPIRFKHLNSNFYISVFSAMWWDHHWWQVINYSKSFKRYWFFFLNFKEKKTVGIGKFGGITESGKFILCHYRYS